MKVRSVHYQGRISLSVIGYEDDMPCPLFCAFVGRTIDQKRPGLSNPVFYISDKLANGCIPLYLTCEILGVTIIDLITQEREDFDTALFLAYACCFDRRFLAIQAKAYAKSPVACAHHFKERFNPNSKILVQKTTYAIRAQSISYFLQYLGSGVDRKKIVKVIDFIDKFKESVNRFSTLLNENTGDFVDSFDTPGYVKAEPIYNEKNGPRNFLIRLIADELGWGKIRISSLNTTDIHLFDGHATVSGRIDPVSKELAQLLREYLEHEIPVMSDGQVGSPLFMTSKGKRLTPVAISKILEAKRA